MKQAMRTITALALLLFALLTLFLSGAVIFDLFGIRQQEGNYVLFVVWANFISSVLYLAAAAGLIKFKKWPYILLLMALLILVAAFIGLNIHINSGGLHEAKTFYAMIFRIGVTLLFTVAAYFLKSTQFTRK